jgi:hypothetical protein
MAQESNLKPESSLQVCGAQGPFRSQSLVTFERFLGFCKLRILTFVKASQIAALRFSCDLASGRAATIVQYQLVI